jgi:hypothetical protein
MRSNDGYLFNGTSVFDVLTRLKARVPEAVDGMDANAFLNSSTDELIEIVASQCAVEVPTLLRDKAHVDEPNETTIAMNDFGRQIHLPAASFLLNVPFTGNSEAFEYPTEQLHSEPAASDCFWERPLYPGDGRRPNPRKARQRARQPRR